MFLSRSRHISPRLRPASKTLLHCETINHSSKNPRKSSQAVLQTRMKQTASSSENARKEAISRAISNSRNKKSATDEELFVDNIFGMRPVDYTVIPPIPKSPPPPPPKPGMRKYIFPASLAVALGTFGYFYLNNKNDNFEYWSAMQRGEALQMDDDDDDDEENDE
mmetsp:Transcript_11136/g.22677  ORF Transcript_11136/g.22677 Transcript_11136/m.22677 type:complete len:165 (+) Transcript_11136:186-680(+)